MAEKLLNMKELAEFLGCTRQTLYNYMERGMPKIQKDTKHALRFDKDQVLKWLEDGQA